MEKKLNEHEMAVGSTTLYTLVEDDACARDHQQGSENGYTSGLVRHHHITFALIS